MKRTVLIVSVGLNLVLVVAAIHVKTKPAATGPVSAAPRPAVMVVTAENTPTLSPVRDTVTLMTNRFHWRRIESENYAQYVANLRGIGCPEKTIRDIVVADVEKLYVVKGAAVLLRTGFWSAGTKRAAAARAQEAERRTLEAEKSALLKSVLGSDCARERDEHTDDLIEQAIMRFVLGPMSEDALANVFATMKKGERLAKEIESRANGILLPEDEEAVARVHNESLAELKRLLTSEEFEEFAARTAAMGMMDHNLEYFRTTAAELRQIAHIHAAVFGMSDEKPFDLFNNRQRTTAQEREFETRLKAYLGESRFAEFQRAGDPVFRGLAGFSEKNQLPAGTAVKVYQIKELADAGRESLEADSSLAGPEREAQMHDIQDATRLAVQRVLGDKAFEAYLQQGNGQWVTNFAKPRE